MKNKPPGHGLPNKEIVDVGLGQEGSRTAEYPRLLLHMCEPRTLEWVAKHESYIECKHLVATKWLQIKSPSLLIYYSWNIKPLMLFYLINYT